MILDSHCHLEPVEDPVEKMIQVMDAGGVDTTVLLAATSENLPSVPMGLLALGRTLLQTSLAGLARRCEQLSLPLLIHMGNRLDTGNVQGLSDACPDLKLILAHLGIPWFERSWAQAKRCPNVYLDISGPYLSAGLVAKAVKVVGADKLIYGTDGPYGLRTIGGDLDYAQSKAWVERLPIGRKD